ncbi:uncharacterized protein A4U43_C05F11650 [Asparagus officinalis]|uniref:Uncharacterized protein n=1 Tax=Asparagus officinalis TaxID=4686 RepID=A0A5P1EUQ2_ASPOF|nr:uncharacterized protein A4U43_C05F11650 [Asparagus officinalis]
MVKTGSYTDEIAELARKKHVEFKENHLKWLEDGNLHSAVFTPADSLCGQSKFDKDSKPKYRGNIPDIFWKVVIALAELPVSVYAFSLPIFDDIYESSVFSLHLLGPFRLSLAATFDCLMKTYGFLTPDCKEYMNLLQRVKEERELKYMRKRRITTCYIIV